MVKIPREAPFRGTPGGSVKLDAARNEMDAAQVVEQMLEHGFDAGLPLAAVGAGGPNDLLIAVTEKRSHPELDAFADALESTLCS